MLPGLGVPGLSVLMDLVKEGDLDLMVLIGMERLVGLKNMPGEAMETDLYSYNLKLLNI